MTTGILGTLEFRYLIVWLFGHVDYRSRSSDAKIRASSWCLGSRLRACGAASRQAQPAATQLAKRAKSGRPRQSCQRALNLIISSSGYLVIDLFIDQITR